MVSAWKGDLDGVLAGEVGVSEGKGLRWLR